MEKTPPVRATPDGASTAPVSPFVPGVPGHDSSRRPAPPLGMILVIALGLAVTAMAARPLPPDEKLRRDIHSAYARKDWPAVIRMGETGVARGWDLGTSGDDLAWAFMNANTYDRAAGLLCEGKIKARAATLNHVGMGLQTASAEKIDLGICCLKKAVGMEPESVALNYSLGLLNWNGGHVEEARKQCEKVVKLDPGNIQASQILERIEKQNYRSGHSGDTVARRKVTFQLKLPLATAPTVPLFISGSWDSKGDHDMLRGFQRVPLPRLPDIGSEAVWEFSRELGTEEGDWYSAVVSTSDKPWSPALFLARFPLYPYETSPLTVPLHKCPVQPPEPLVAPRPRGTRAKRGSRPRLYMLCVDSATWNIFMPFMQAGMMPRLSALASAGTMCEMHCDPPVSTISFDILNFGAGGQFGIKEILLGGVELLKERGVDLLHAAGIQGKDHTWKLLATQGFPTLYSSWGEQLSYDLKGTEIAHEVTVDPVTTTVSGVIPSGEREIVVPFLPLEERKDWTGMKISDHLIVDHYQLGVKKFYESIELVRKTQAVISMVHVGFIDVGYHAFWDAMDSDIAFIKPDYPRNARYARVIENMHRLLDVLVGELEQEFDFEHDSFILWSDHGATGGFAKTYYGHDTRAMLIFSGPLFKPGVVLDRVPDIADLAPTLFSAFKVKAPATYTGKAILEAIR